MRYGITLLILSMSLLLSGYNTLTNSKTDTSSFVTINGKTGKDSGKSNGKTSAANSGKRSDSDDVHEDGELTKRELRIISNNLNDIGYYGFLLSDYNDPKFIDWDEVFYNGAGIDEEYPSKQVINAYLKKTASSEIMTDLTVISGDKLEEYVEATTGLPYSKMRNPLDWVYLRDYDLYLFEHGDTNQINVDVISGFVEDGIYSVTYRHNNWWGENADYDYTVEFTMNEDYYCFISNTPDKSSKPSASGSSRNTKTSGRSVDDEYIFPDSDSRYLTDADLKGMDNETLRRGRNEIYARYGRKFKDSALQSYFNRQSWYTASNISDSTIERSLNKYEKENIKFISSYENKKTVSSSGSGTSRKTTAAGSGYTEKEICKLAQDYYQRHYGFRPPVSEIDSRAGDIVTIHLYEDMGDHTATSAWYDINIKTGKGTDGIFGTNVDLNK